MNWRNLDRASSYIVRIKKDGSTSKLSCDDWAEIILESELSPKTPNEIRNLFEVAQGVLCYGAFFYPLYTLGSEQLYRVLEAALRHRCAALNAPKNVKTFDAMLKLLEKKQLMSKSQLGRWHAARELRNLSSHATQQSIYDPTMAVRNVKIAIELIDGLFNSPC